MDLDPQSRAVLDGLNASGILPFRQFTPQQLRERMLELRVSAPETVADDGIDATDETVATAHGPMRVRILRPRTASTRDRSPAVVFFHGGGFLMGGVEESDATARAIASRADVIVVNVDYHLSPETKFPGAVEQAYAALCWVRIMPNGSVSIWTRSPFQETAPEAT